MGRAVLFRLLIVWGILFILFISCFASKEKRPSPSLASDEHYSKRSVRHQLRLGQSVATLLNRRVVMLNDMIIKEAKAIR